MRQAALNVRHCCPEDGGVLNLVYGDLRGDRATEGTYRGEDDCVEYSHVMQRAPPSDGAPSLSLQAVRSTRRRAWSSHRTAVGRQTAAA